MMGIFLITLLATGIVEASAASPPTMERRYSESAGLHYLLTFPEGYHDDPTEEWPLILFLHGAGERGDDLDYLMVHGMPRMYNQLEKFPFITVSPQCPANTTWNSLISNLRILLEEVMETYNVDEGAIYLTGISMGGRGAWELAMTYPEMFAALAPIAGGGDPANIANLIDIPVWAFHGDADNVVPIEENIRMVDALEAIGGDVEFTVYPRVGHDSWTQTYENPELYEWFLGHMRRTIARQFTPDIVELPTMRVLYARNFEENSENNALQTVIGFAEENGMNQRPGFTYFGRNLVPDITRTGQGFEAFILLEDSDRFSDTGNLQIRFIPSQQYVRFPTSNNTLGLQRVRRTLAGWNRDYGHFINFDDKLKVFRTAEDGTQQFAVYVPITLGSPNDMRLSPGGMYYSEGGDWEEHYYGRIIHRVVVGQDYAQWNPEFEQPGFYEVFVYKTVYYRGDPRTQIEITHAAGQSQQYLDFSSGIMEWVSLGIYQFDAGNAGQIRIGPTTARMSVCVSDVRLRYIPDEKIRNFPDMQGHWAERSVREMAYRGVIDGFEDGTFQPEEAVTVEAFVKMLITALGYQLEQGQEHWSTPFLEKAISFQIIHEREFVDYSLPITRLQMAQLAGRALTDRRHIESLDTYVWRLTDLYTLNDAEREAVLTVFANGIITGFEDQSFRPDENMTRAQGAEVILRLIRPGIRRRID